MSNMARLEAIALVLPEATRVDIEAWDGEPTFRVRNKNFVFTDPEVVVATDPLARPTGYGMGRAGWVSVDIGEGADEDRWQQVTEWVRTSYTLVAPKTLARIVLEEDGLVD